MEGFFERYEHSIKIIGVILAACFALFQYYSYLDEEKVKYTFAFYEKYTEEPIFSAKVDVLENFEEMKKHRDRTFPSQSQISPANIPRARLNWKNIFVDALSSKNLVVKTDLLISFFDALQVCIENRICDKTSAVKLLQPSAKKIMENNCPYIGFVINDLGSNVYAKNALAFAESKCLPRIYKILENN